MVPPLLTKRSAARSQLPTTNVPWTTTAMMTVLVLAYNDNDFNGAYNGEDPFGLGRNGPTLVLPCLHLHRLLKQMHQPPR